jgi:phytoene dehydrogenase-like protein
LSEGVQTSAVGTLGCIGLPEPVSTLAARRWDAIVVGAGHNGLTCAAYLARAGKAVLVVEARDRVGGACTLEDAWPGYRVSPCAYLCGLLHPVVIRELELPAHGFQWTPADAGLFVPFEDGESIQFWEDDERCEAEIRRIAPGDVAGWRALGALKSRMRARLRPDSGDDVWLGPAPSREDLEARLGDDPDAHALLFEWSMAEYLAHFLDSERLRMALLGQGVIGTRASPFDPGTASIHFHHSCGCMQGMPGAWGYVRGGMGMVSFILCDVARELGARVATGLRVSRILPGEGVELVGGERIHAPIVISNADPATTAGLLGERADAEWKATIDAIPMTGCTVKVNLAMSELPDFRARPGTREPHHLGQVNTPLLPDQWRSSFQEAESGRLPGRLWTELYFQTAHDPGIAPPGRHLVSVFAQYVPYGFAEGTWDTRRAEVGERVVQTLADYCSNLPDSVIDLQVLGPPDIEERVGLSGGHIFQGECLPGYLWDRRPGPRTPMPGIFLCGAGTHPGGSVIAVNGRNAAMAVLGVSSERRAGGIRR